MGLTATAARAARAGRARNARAWDIPAFGPWPSDDDHHHVVIIGAGIGGLTAGALLAQRGLKVAVFEAHDRPGGFCSSWIRKVRLPQGVRKFTFDAGVQDFSGLGPRGPLRNLLRQLGAEAAIDWRRVHHRYWRDGLTFDVPARGEDIPQALGRLFPAETTAIIAFFHEIEAVYREMYTDVETTGGVPMAPTDPTELMAWPGRHPHAWRWMKQPFAVMLDSYLTDPNLKHLLTTLSEYLTEQPELLSVEDMAPLYGYYFDGGYYPAGGAQRLAEVLARVILERGGQITFKSTVEAILTEGERVVGVRCVGGKGSRAGLVVANGDVVAMLTDLLDRSILPPSYLDWIGSLRRGPTAMLLSLALDTVPDLPARIFVSRDGFDFGIGNPSAIDTSLAPEGAAALTMLRLLPEGEGALWRRGARDYRERKNAFAAQMIDATIDSVLPDLRRHILQCDVATPETFARYVRTRGGTIYGMARDQSCPHLHSPLPGLLLVGAGTTTGAGIEAVAVSGTLAANAVLPPQAGPVIARHRAC